MWEEAICRSKRSASEREPLGAITAPAASVRGDLLPGLARPAQLEIAALPQGPMPEREPAMVHYKKGRLGFESCKPEAT